MNFNRYDHVLSMALWVQNCGYWLMILSVSLLAFYTQVGGSGLAYWLLAWPSLWLTLISDILSFLGFYLVGILIFLFALWLVTTKANSMLLKPMIIYVVSGIVAVTSKWYTQTHPMGLCEYLKSTFAPWFR